MNTPSPLVPQGAQANARRSPIAWVFAAIVIHVGVVALCLLQGCKNEEPAKPLVDATPPPPTLATDTNVPALIGGLPPTPTPPPPGVPNGATPAANFALPTPGGASPISNLPPLNGGGLPPAPAGGGVNPLPPTGAAPIPFDPAPTTPSTEHIVVKGDTGGAIAKKYNMGWKAIEAANAGVDARKLKLGQKLIIPAKSVSAAPAGRTDRAADATGGSEGSSYTVKSGDTLGKIAKSHGVSVKALQSANGLKTTSILVGKKLKIPAKAGAAAPVPATDPTPLPLGSSLPLPVPSLPEPVTPAPGGLPPAPRR